MPDRLLQINPQRYSGLVVDRSCLRRAFELLDGLEGFGAPAGEISLAFVTDEELAGIHDEFLGDPSPTDVITFPGDPEMDFAGEICVSVDRAQDEAPKHGWTFSEELTLYLVHGWLHLAGLGDLDDDQRAEMRRAEEKCLSWLRQHEAIPIFEVIQLGRFL